ncbi:MAG: hypothetical protein ACKVT0_08570, partial [Planctomycetaceae bacterium]
MTRKFHRPTVIVLGTACMVWSFWAISAHAVGPRDHKAQAWQYQSSDEANHFAVAIRGESTSQDAQSVHHIILLVDTSASQKGDHRQRTMQVLQQTLANLSPQDLVQLYAIDVDVTPLTEAFVAGDSDAMTQAMTTLNRRVPLGSSDLELGITASSDALAGVSNGSILYFGDGMSTAALISQQNLEDLTNRLRKSEIQLHSFAVGPRTDLKLLGTLAQFSGGTVTVDGAVTTSEDASVVGKQLVAAVNVAVEYPATIDFGSSSARIFPKQALPLRSDRDTIYLGQGELPGEVVIHHDSTSQADDAQHIRIVAEAANEENKFLAPLWKRAMEQNGMNVPFAGTDLLEIARSDFNHQVQQLVALGGEAVEARDLNAAEEIGLVLKELDPQNKRFEKLQSSTNQLRLRLVKQQVAQNDAANDEAPEPAAETESAIPDEVLNSV